MKSLIVFCLCLSTIWAVPFAKKKASIVPHGSGRIVGGSSAGEDQFRWQVAVYYDTSDGSFFCGGALIAPNWVVTAGHCVYHATVFTLHLGSNSLEQDDPFRVTLGTASSQIHPDYNPETLENDIGLIRIDTEYETNVAIKPIPIATTALGANVSVIVSGWGATGDWDGVVDYLNYVHLSTISNEQCKAIYGEAVITDGMVCAVGANNEGTCNGDSGSPLVTVDVNWNAVLVGVVSWASSVGCETDHPSGYTRIATYADWINSIIGA